MRTELAASPKQNSSLIDGVFMLQVLLIMTIIYFLVNTLGNVFILLYLYVWII